MDTRRRSTMKEYNDPDNRTSVELDRRNWFRILGAMSGGVKHIDDDTESEYLDGLIDEVIDQADISIVEVIDIEAELRYDH